MIEEAAQAISRAEALLITAGAGMGVDSGLPDFRGSEGFWEAYPAFRRLGLSFYDLANPTWFRHDPELAWGFYGHRQNLYRDTAPHEGFAILRRWAGMMPGSAFVFTSNVDGHFQKAGFAEERVVECHGGIERLQCARPCRRETWPAGGTWIAVDPETFRAAAPLPACPHCGALARPNVLMFNDYGWVEGPVGEASRRMEEWLAAWSGRRMAVVECGAGTAIPTVRRLSEAVSRELETPLVRINVREPGGPRGTISLGMGALEALRAIDAALRRVQA